MKHKFEAIDSKGKSLGFLEIPDNAETNEVAVELSKFIAKVVNSGQKFNRVMARKSE